MNQGDIMFDLESKAKYNHYYNCIVKEELGATQHSMSINLETKTLSCGCNSKRKFCDHKLAFMERFENTYW